MRLVTFSVGKGEARVGALFSSDTLIADLTAAERLSGGRCSEAFASMQGLIDGGERSLNRAREHLDNVERGALDACLNARAVKLHAPVPCPVQMRDFLCFEEHLINARKMRFRKMAANEPDPEAAYREMVARGLEKSLEAFRKVPVHYKPNRFNVVGPDTEIEWPRYTELLDFELEFGLFIGRGGKNIRREDALRHVFGYTIFNDVSARDTQSREMESMIGPGKGKDFDTGNPMGPCVVTADEIPDPYRLRMKVRINGEEWTDNTSATMNWRFEDIITHISTDETLHPGEFLASGTVGGGCGLEHDRWLKPGDLIELEVEKIGVLRNRVVRHVQPSAEKSDHAA
jgi:2-keto-4-pentenoate hydratase/2-oxohepta-3-ene-1,7-dioic acid hydratase in catechol pathway